MFNTGRLQGSVNVRKIFTYLRLGLVGLLAVLEGNLVSQAACPVAIFHGNCYVCRH